MGEGVNVQKITRSRCHPCHPSVTLQPVSRVTAAKPVFMRVLSLCHPCHSAFIKKSIRKKREVVILDYSSMKSLKHNNRKNRVTRVTRVTKRSAAPVFHRERAIFYTFAKFCRCSICKKLHVKEYAKNDELGLSAPDRA